MINNWLNALRQFGELLREIYLVPGEFMLSLFAELAPLTAADWGIMYSGNSTVLVAVTAGIFWLLASIIAWRIYLYCQSLLRNSIAVLHTIGFRSGQAASGLKIRDNMLDAVIGATDGYENFRLSPSGATFVAMWQRQRDS